jgi:hypothetical protein
MEEDLVHLAVMDDKKTDLIPLQIQTNYNATQYNWCGIRIHQTTFILRQFIPILLFSN